MRVDGWEERLLQVVQWHRSEPFEWGRTDCAMLFRHCVQVVTGVDPLADLRPWFSRRSAIRSLRRAGYETAVDLVRDRFNEIPIARAGRGDLGIIPTTDPLAAPAIVMGGEVLARTEQGLVILSPADLVTAFVVA